MGYDILKEKLWVAEHSNKQNCYNIDKLNSVIDKNIANVLEQGENDYQIIFIGSYDECNTMINELKKMVDEKKEKINEKDFN